VTTPASPYKGLASFEDSELDELLFFGREREREIIAANLMASRLTVLYGETGVGKSSVLRAAVVRHLRALPEPLEVLVFDEWQDDPAAALRAQLAQAVGAEPADSLADTLELCAALAGGEVFVVLDGLEEYFLYHGAKGEADSFLDDFSEAVARPGLRASFLLSVREDALAKLDRFKGRIPNVLGNYLRLDHLDRSSAREAIVGPVDRYNQLSTDGRVEIEPALVETVLDQVAAGKVELGRTGRGGVDEDVVGGRIEAPFLQLVMARLWETERASGSRVLRLQTLVELGGAEQVVRDHLDGALAALSPEQQDLAASVFNHLVTPSGAKIAHDAADLAGYVGAAPPELTPVLASLAAQRILRPVPGVPGSDIPRYEIYHDILADAVLAWRSRHEAARELGRVREGAAKRHRRLLLVAAAAVLLAGAMAGVTIFAFTQRSEARAQARKAHARALDASALSQLPLDPELSLLLASEAAMRDRSAGAEDVLRRTLLASRERGTFRAGGKITVARFSPDASKILVAAGDGTARVYDARTHRLLLTLRQGAPITSGAFSSDGRTVLTAGANGRIELWSAQDGRLLRVLRNGAAVRSAAFDPSGTHVIAAGGHVVKLWSRGGSTPVWAHRLDWPVTGVLFSPDGGFVAVIGNDRDALLYHADSGVLDRTFDQGDFVKCMAFSPRGAYLVTGGRNKTARIWDVRTGRLLHELTGHTQDVVGIAFSPNGLTVATASSDGTARTWSVATGGPEATFAGHTNGIATVAFSPGARYLLTASSDRTARVWKNTGTPQVVALLAGDRDGVTQAVFSLDGKQVLTGSDDHTARLWDPSQPTLEILAQEPGAVLGATYAGSSSIVLAGPGSDVRFIRSSDGKSLRSASFADAVAAVSLTRDRTFAAVATGRHVDLVRASDAAAESVITQPSVVNSVAISPDGSRIATAGTDGIARLWTVDGRLLRELKGHRRALTGIAFSPDGKLVATSSRDVTAKIWDARTGRLLHTLVGHMKTVTSVAFSPDGRFVLTASEDRDARLWSVNTGETVPPVLRWHFGTVRDAQFSPDGRWIVTVGPQTAQLWQPGIQEPLLQFGIGGPSKALTMAVFDPTSRVVLAASEDGTVRTYRCALCGGLDDLLRLARARLSLTGRTLSAADRKLYGG
jgi:WD40 repeat protein